MNFFKQIKSHDQGLTLVEALIAVTIFITLLLSVIGIYNFYLKTALANGAFVQATFLAQEGLEAVRFMRDQSWDNISALSVDTDYYLVFESGTWEATTTQIFIDSMFDRKVIFSEVYRDISYNIVTSGGALDPETLKVTLNISWSRDSSTTTKTISTYIANIFEEE